MSTPPLSPSQMQQAWQFFANQGLVKAVSPSCPECHAVYGLSVLTQGVLMPERHTVNDRGQPCSLFQQLAVDPNAQPAPAPAPAPAQVPAGGP